MGNHFCGMCACVGQSSMGIIQTCGKPRLPLRTCVLGTKAGGLGEPPRAATRRPVRDQDQGQCVRHYRVLRAIPRSRGGRASYHAGAITVRRVLTLPPHEQGSRGRTAFYKLSNPRAQITSYVYDVIRAEVPRLEVDEVFESKDYLAVAVKRELSKTMAQFGFEITNALITDIEPDGRVKDAMNQINAAQRLRAAALDKAEAEKIQIVKQAEADAESKYLAGEHPEAGDDAWEIVARSLLVLWVWTGTGIARQRKAIVDGLRQSVVAFSDKVSGTQSKDVIELMLMTQYFDVLGGLGKDGQVNTVFVPKAQGNELRQGMLEAQAARYR
eukprot:scaffold137_cov398-Prasinococcus_capsulatus_cf.AAC.38